TYSMKVGYACPEIVTGKPVELGGCVGRREATGRGVVYCVMETFKELNINPSEATAVVQGFGNVGSVVCHELQQRGVRIVADAVLDDSDIFVIPDVLCNAGGVTVSYFEWVQDIQQFLWSEAQVNQKLEELMLRAYHQVRKLARDRNLRMRTAALCLGVQKV